MLTLVVAGCTCPTTGGSGSGTTTTPVPTSPTEPPPDPGTTSPPGDTSSGDSQPATPGPAAAAPGQGEECPAGTCAEGLKCVEYYGIAGAAGPKFTSCEIPCPKGAGCPVGQSCVTIADGPGQVCRP